VALKRNDSWMVSMGRYLKEYFVTLYAEEPVPMAALSHALSSAARTLGSWVRTPIEAWMCVRVFCVVLSSVGKWRCVSLIPRSRIPINVQNRFINFRSYLLNPNRP